MERMLWIVVAWTVLSVTISLALAPLIRHRSMALKEVGRPSDLRAHSSGRLGGIRLRD
jgi:hypothetical protein